MTNELKLASAIAIIRAIELRNDPDLDIHMTIRSLLIDDSDRDFDFTAYYADDLRLAIRSLDSDNLSLLRLEYSLCPLHSCDYAICFDDDDAECAQIRDIFPSHDT